MIAPLSHKRLMTFGALLLIPGAGLLDSQSRLSAPLPEEYAVPAGVEWPVVNGDWRNTRYSVLDQINRQTISNLRGVWVSDRFEDGALSRSTPVVKNGLMFVTAGTRVYALDAKNGTIVWRYQTSSKKPVAGLETTRGQARVLESRQALPNSQGVAVGEGLVFVGLTDGRLIALDESTGALRWNTQTGEDPPKRGQSVSTAPFYALGRVYIGLANADFNLRGRVIAVDAKSGKELWHFFTIPAPGEFGHETWPKNSNVWTMGGGGVWQTGNIDPELGMVYFAVGNAVPQTGGEIREGDNLFTGSVLGLDMNTGKLRWHYQVVHHDIWDADGAEPTPTILYDTQVGGQTRKAIAAMRSDGYLFLLDRRNGKPLMPVEERPVPQNPAQKTAATQPFPVGADSISPPCSEWKKEIPDGFELGCTYSPYIAEKPNVLAPGFGVRVSPMSYSPQTGYFYAQGVDALGGRRRFSSDPWFFLVGPASGGVPLLNLPVRGFFAAIDSRTNKVVWKKEVPGRMLGRSGLMTTGGGLMFHGGEDGNFEAYDAQTGERLWQFQIGVGSTPASTYEINGEQYIAMAAGASVWAFKLGGAIQPLPARLVETTNAENPGTPLGNADRIETASLVRDLANGGQRYAVDEHTFNPTRAQVTVGARVIWVNNGKQTHTIMARDRSWVTHTMKPSEEAAFTFEKTGTFLYICKEHPWAIGQITVVAAEERPASADTFRATSGTSANRGSGFYSVAQARRGQDLYTQRCGGCHLENLGGNGQAPPLSGQTFQMQWEGRPIADLYGKISSTMPPTSPGGLTAQVYLDIVAFLLQVNNYQAGASELGNTPDVMRKTLRR